MNNYQIPQYLDEPLKIILWTLDEVLVFLVPFFLLFLEFNQPFVAVFVSIALVIGLKKLKGDRGISFIYGWMYWHFPSLIRFKSFPPSCIRELWG